MTKLINFAKHLAKNHLSAVLSLGFLIIFATTLNIMASAPVGGYNPGDTLNPDCTPGSTDCIIKPTAGFETEITAGTTSDYWRGDKTFQTLDTSVVPENGNQYYTDDKARLSISSNAPLIYDNLSGLFSITQSDTSNDGFLSSTDWNIFNNKQDALGYTPEDIANKDVAGGYASLDGSTKIPLALIPSSLVGSVNYKGTWDADTNTPALTDGSGSKGDYYVVSTSGSTLIDGIASWSEGDWIISNDTPVWEKVSNTDSVNSVNGLTGIVDLTPTLSSSTDGAPVVFDGTTGKTFKEFAPTTGSILFAGASGELAQNNSNLFWDDLNGRLGVGTVVPWSQLDIVGSTNSNGTLRVKGSGEYKRGILYLETDDVNVGNSHEAGRLSFLGLDSGTNSEEYGTVLSQLVNTTDSTE